MEHDPPRHETMRALLLPGEERQPHPHPSSTAVEPERECKMWFADGRRGGQPDLLTRTGEHCGCRVEVYILAPSSLFSLDKNQLSADIHDQACRVTLQEGTFISIVLPFTRFPVTTPLSCFCPQVSEGDGHNAGRMDGEGGRVNVLHLGHPRNN